MKNSKDILSKIKLLIDGYRTQNLFGLISIFTPVEVIKLEEFLKEALSCTDTYFSKATLGKLLSILVNRTSEITAGSLFDDLENFLGITTSQMKMFKKLSVVNLDNEINLATVYLYRNELEPIFLSVMKKNSKIQQMIFSTLLKYELTKFHLDYLNSIISFQKKHKLNDDLLEQTKTVIELSVIAEIITVINAPNDSTIKKYYHDKLDSIEQISKAIKKLLINKNQYNLQDIRHTIKLYVLNELFIYERLNEILPSSLLQNEDELQRLMSRATYDGKDLAIKILHMADMWSYDNYHRVVNYESQNDYSIYSAAGLYLAKVIKDKYLGRNIKAILPAIEQIINEIEELYIETYPNHSKFPLRLRESFQVLIMLCRDDLFEREEFLEIARATLEVILNHPNNTNFLNMAVQCCISENAPKNDFLSIIDSMCIPIKNSEPFINYFGEKEYINYYTNPTIEEHDKEPLFHVLLEHVEKLKNDRSYLSEHYYKHKFMFFFKSEHNSDAIDKTRYLIQEPSFCRMSRFEPKLFSFNGDIYQRDKFSSKNDDIRFNFQ